MFRTITLELGQKHFYATDFSASFKIVHQHAKPKNISESTFTLMKRLFRSTPNCTKFLKSVDMATLGDLQLLTLYIVGR